MKPPPEPPSFDEKVRKPGQRLLMELRGDPAAPMRRGPKRKQVDAITSDNLRAFWTACLDDLAGAFNHVCAYSCIHIDPITGDRTVDHFKPKATCPDDAYEWSNYRFSCGLMNARKERLNGKGRQVCDPFVIKDGWFELNLLTFGLKPSGSLSPEDHERAQQTIDALELDRDAMRKRRADAWNKFANNRSPEGWRLMEEDCPLIAKEYIRQRGTPEFPGEPPP